MHFSTIIGAALFGAAITLGVPTHKRTILCPGTPDTPQCCAVNALGVADLNCAPRTSCRSILRLLRPRNIPLPSRVFVFEEQRC